MHLQTNKSAHSLASLIIGKLGVSLFKPMELRPSGVAVEGVMSSRLYFLPE